MTFPDILTDIDRLYAQRPLIEDFGPQSDFPFLAFDLAVAKSVPMGWLSNLPCPVIGIGLGPLMQACDIVLKNAGNLNLLRTNILAAPFASMVLVQHLRASAGLSMISALSAESFAYATLQAGPEFLEWKSNYSGERTLVASSNPLKIDRHEHTLALAFDDPDNRNAIGVDMRDAFCQALDLAIADPSIARVTLTGKGRTFSTGGAVEEFGQVNDPATAHWIRSLRLPALRLAQISDRLHIHVNGAAIGAGAEILGFADHVTAASNAWFQLPELKYGLIPGAGGTAGLPRRIGRQKTAYLALSMEKLSAQKALDWGLVDGIV